LTYFSKVSPSEKGGLRGFHNERGCLYDQVDVIDNTHLIDRDKEVFKMGPKWLKIKVDAETGKWKVKDDTPQGPEEIDASEIPGDASEIGVILHSHSSPG
jgi:hypothetical protein